MSLERKHDWRERLAAALQNAATARFEWGKHDCALHVCNCVEAMTGVDLAADYRGRYADEFGAAQIYGSSFEEFVSAVANAHGLVEVPPTMAGRGDVVFVENGTPHGALAIVSMDGRFACCVESEEGLVMVRMHRWRRAWRVTR